MPELTIGGVAKRAGVHVETLRYYERRGLVQEPPRTPANYRAYPAETVRRVRFIKRAQELGFKLDEISELLDLRAAPKTQCGAVKRRAEAKLDDIDVKMRDLRRMKRALSRLVGQCSGKGPVTLCPILEAIDDEAAE
jgi:MerR family mercuric resistance operon transcriptional regulator